MISNTLSMLLFFTRRNAKFDGPVAYAHMCGGDLYSIVVTKMPKQESVAA